MLAVLARRIAPVALGLAGRSLFFFANACSFGLRRRAGSFLLDACSFLEAQPLGFRLLGRFAFHSPRLARLGNGHALCTPGNDFGVIGLGPVFQLFEQFLLGFGSGLAPLVKITLLEVLHQSWLSPHCCYGSDDIVDLGVDLTYPLGEVDSGNGPSLLNLPTEGRKSP